MIQRFLFSQFSGYVAAPMTTTPCGLKKGMSDESMRKLNHRNKNNGLIHPLFFLDFIEF